MSSPFLRELSIFQKAQGVKGGAATDGMPKSLPSSPTSARRDYGAKIGEDLTMKTMVAAKNVLVEGFAKVNGVTEVDSNDETTSGGAQDETHDAVKSSGNNTVGGAVKKFKANSLFSHPLFKSGGNADEGEYASIPLYLFGVYYGNFVALFIYIIFQPILIGLQKIKFSNKIL